MKCKIPYDGASCNLNNKCKYPMCVEGEKQASKEKIPESFDVLLDQYMRILDKHSVLLKLYASACREREELKTEVEALEADLYELQNQ